MSVSGEWVVVDAVLRNRSQARGRTRAAGKFPGIRQINREFLKRRLKAGLGGRHIPLLFNGKRNRRDENSRQMEQGTTGNLTRARWSIQRAILFPAARKGAPPERTETTSWWPCSRHI